MDDVKWLREMANAIASGDEASNDPEAYSAALTRATDALAREPALKDALREAADALRNAAGMLRDKGLFADADQADADASAALRALDEVKP